jgi:hypothetical protein
MDTTPHCPFSPESRPKGIVCLKATAEVWDQLKYEGFRPSGCDNGVIVFNNAYQFKKAFQGREASETVSSNGTILTLWVGPVALTTVIPGERTDNVVEIGPPE